MVILKILEVVNIDDFSIDVVRKIFIKETDCYSNENYLKKVVNIGNFNQARKLLDSNWEVKVNFIWLKKRSIENTKKVAEIDNKIVNFKELISIVIKLLNLVVFNIIEKKDISGYRINVQDIELMDIDCFFYMVDFVNYKDLINFKKRSELQEESDWFNCLLMNLRKYDF